MDARTQLYADFAARFSCDGLHGPAHPCDQLELDGAEVALATFLPESYRQFIGRHGPLFVPQLWHAVVQRELDAHPVREFFSPNEVVNATRLYWSAGMPDDFVGVACDFMGNMFGFQRVAMNGGRPDDLPVSLFDHDFVRVDPVAPSFDAWLRWFTEHVGKVETNG